jgi:hypothetical protein
MWRCGGVMVARGCRAVVKVKERGHRRQERSGEAAERFRRPRWAQENNWAASWRSEEEESTHHIEKFGPNALLYI